MAGTGIATTAADPVNGDCLTTPVLSQGIFEVWPALNTVAPVVFDSPHSGTDYPDSFDFVCPFDVLRRAEDTHVHALFADAPTLGAPLLRALFPRSFLDVNRAVDDLDPDLLAGPWPEPLNPSIKSRYGMGLIRRLCQTDMPVYGRRLTVQEVEGRIARYYHPYHQRLQGLADAAHRRFGTVVHINCHSMPAFGTGLSVDTGRPRADIVLGDRDGTTCHPDLTRLCRAVMEAKGYSVAINDPFKGVELVRRHGHPSVGRHSLQVEINRRLYMNESTMERLSRFDRVREDVRALCVEIVGFGRALAAV